MSQRRKRTYSFQKVIFVYCSGCNENIVERSDEGTVDTMARAREYAREHEARHRADEAQDQPSGP